MTKLDQSTPNSVVHSADNTINTLAQLETHLNFIEQQINVESELGTPTFMIDWDVIQMFAEFRFTSSIYAVSIFRSIEEAVKAKLKLIVAQGARMEYTYYVAHSLSKYYRNIENFAVDDDAKEGLYEDPNYNREHERLSRARNISEIGSLLDKFSRKYSRSLNSLEDGPFNKISMRDLKQTNEFKNAYSEISSIRPTGPRRNTADAANIAVLDLAQSNNFNYKLVTSTRILSDIRPNKVIDPITFLLMLHHTSLSHSNFEVALNNVRRMRTRISQFILQSNDIRHAAIKAAKNSGGFITPKRAREWVKHLDELKNDDIIGDTVGIISASQLDAQSRYSMLEEHIQNEYIEPPVKSFPESRRVITHLGGILADMYNDNELLEDLHYKWMPKKKLGDTISRVLKNDRNEVILNISVNSKYFVATWPTANDLKVFYDFISKEISNGNIKLTTNSAIKLYFHDRPAITFNIYKKGIGNAYVYSSNIFMNSIRVFCSGIQFIFDTSGDTCNKAPEVSIIADIDFLDNAYLFYSATFLEYIPQEAFYKSIKELSIMIN